MTGPLIVLCNVLEVVGALGVLYGLIALVTSSPKRDEDWL